MDLAMHVEAMTASSAGALVSQVDDYIYDAHTDFVSHVSTHIGGTRYSYWRKPNGSTWIWHNNFFLPGPS